MPARGHRRISFQPLSPLRWRSRWSSASAQRHYFRILSPSPMATLSGGPVTLLVHAHAALFSTWVLLFIAQTTLVAQRRMVVHRRLGVVGGVLAALMVVSGTVTALKMVARGSAPEGADPRQFLMIPLSDMVFFGGFVAAALFGAETAKRTNA